MNKKESLALVSMMRLKIKGLVGPVSEEPDGLKGMGSRIKLVFNVPPGFQEERKTQGAASQNHCHTPTVRR